MGVSLETGLGIPFSLSSLTFPLVSFLFSYSLIFPAAPASYHVDSSYILGVSSEGLSTLFISHHSPEYSLYSFPTSFTHAPALPVSLSLFPLFPFHFPVFISLLPLLLPLNPLTHLRHFKGVLRRAKHFVYIKISKQ